MAELDHPTWCAAGSCTAGRPPFNGTSIGAHRSSPEPVGLSQVRLRQGSEDALPSVEVRRGDAVLVLPVVEAQSLGAALEDLLRLAGVGL